MGILVQLWFAGSQLQIQDGPYRENVLDLEVLPKLFLKVLAYRTKKIMATLLKSHVHKHPPEPGVLSYGHMSVEDKWGF